MWDQLTTWVKLDNRLPDDPRQAAAGVAGFGFYVTAQCYANRMGTRGFVPKDMALRLVRPDEHPEQLIETLVRVGVWLPTTVNGIDGFQIHDDFQQHQLTHEQIADRRQRKADAGRKGGVQSGVSRRSRSRTEADAKQTPSKAEADAKQVLPDLPSRTEADAKQTRSTGPSKVEAKRSPSPSPSPITDPENRTRGVRKDREGVQGKPEGNLDHEGKPAGVTAPDAGPGWELLRCPRCGEWVARDGCFTLRDHVTGAHHSGWCVQEKARAARAGSR